MSRGFIQAWRLYLLSFCIMAGFGAVCARLYYLHVYQQEELQVIAEKNRYGLERVHSRRGNIVDSRGNLLATSRTMMQLGVDPQIVRESDLEKIPELARLIDVPAEQIRQAMTTKLRRGSDEFALEVQKIRWARLAEKIDERTYQQVMDLRIRGVYGNRVYDRIYPNNQLASHVIGFINKEETPVMGVERFLDFYLKGEDGWLEVEHDGRRREMPQFRRREVNPADGLNVELTIDSVIQHYVEMEVRRIVEDYDPQGVSIIVSDPSTGFILGLANYPSFDPNRFWEFPVDYQRNRAVTDVYEPGSTFKIIPAAGALEERLVRSDTVFDCSVSVVEYRGRRVSLPRDHRTYNALTVREIMEKSSNRGAAMLGMALGSERLHNYAKRFGFGERTGFGLGGEVNGTLHAVNRWDGLTISRLPMGHAVSATPMQVHYATSVIANDGVLMTPMLIRRVFDSNGDTVVDFLPRAKHRVVSPQTADEIAEMLVGTVNNDGTGGRAAIPGFEVAGKTGTTQKIVNGRYSSQNHVGSFSGFFPASRPRLVITVVVDDPQRDRPGYGGKVAAPAFRNISEQLIQYMAIRKPEQDQNILALGGNQP